ncbi:MAG: hypothetical protein A2074_07400 [Candidatus Aquicultor primus]|uniref:Chromosomal replication initiator DnaA C-terminal domain-containing protein n=1 Tax=Candidatus Aquicultor primus TaxID=1797195 RepID=A0A1F2UVB1_9ACTN|nr:MAG: hypothetical protein A2074_07400 [Candidatus Aquicultor primus]
MKIFYGIDPADLYRPRANRAARDIVIYLCRQLGGYDLKTIARQFKMSYTRVSQIVGKISAGAKSDKDLQELLRSL